MEILTGERAGTILIAERFGGADMKVYCDTTEENGCCGLILRPGVEVVYTGSELHTEPEKLRGYPLALRLAEECDLNFWFGKDRPEQYPYTVPKSEIVGFDSRGGFFAATEDRWLAGAAPLYYIDANLVCHRIDSEGRPFADMGQSWRETMAPTDEIEAFPDRATAGERYEIRSVREIMAELK